MTVIPPGLSLVVRRRIGAAAVDVFAAWTQPEHLMRWWGPRDVQCVEASIDLRVGGRYRIGNRFSDGRMLWIVGEFESISPPHELVYSWCTETDVQPSERVTVSFEPHGAETEVVVIHELILAAATRDGHEAGWQDCLDGLGNFLATA